MKTNFGLSKCCDVGSIKHFCNFAINFFAYYLDDNALGSISEIDVWWKIKSFKGGMFA